MAVDSAEQKYFVVDLELKPLADSLEMLCEVRLMSRITRKFSKVTFIARPDWTLATVQDAARLAAEDLETEV